MALCDTETSARVLCQPCPYMWTPRLKALMWTATVSAGARNLCLCLRESSTCAAPPVQWGGGRGRGDALRVNMKTTWRLICAPS